MLGYDWKGDAAVRWDLAEPGTVISAMSGGYYLAEAAGQTTATYELTVDIRIPMPGMLKRKAEKMHHRHGAEGAQGSGRGGGAEGRERT